MHLGRPFSVLSALVLAAVAAAPATGAPATDHPSQAGYSFAVIGDVPYGDAQLAA
jgi:hypothetical protein